MAVSVHGQPTCAWLASPAPSSSTRVVSGRHAAVTHAPAQRAYARLARSCALRRLTARAEGKQATKAQAEEDEVPVWARREAERERQKQDGSDLPFGVYLLASAIVAIAAVGSIFEFANRNAIFGALPPSSPFYAPILLTFALTGLPSAGYLFFKAISSANKEAERQDKADGF